MVYDADTFWDFEVRKVSKFGNFQANLIEFQVQIGHFLVRTQCPNCLRLIQIIITKFVELFKSPCSLKSADGLFRKNRQPQWNLLITSTRGTSKNIRGCYTQVDYNVVIPVINRFTVLMTYTYYPCYTTHLSGLFISCQNPRECPISWVIEARKLQYRPIEMYCLPNLRRPMNEQHL